jgi:hypothetical protein
MLTQMAMMTMVSVDGCAWVNAGMQMMQIWIQVDVLVLQDHSHGYVVVADVVVVFGLVVDGVVFAEPTFAVFVAIAVA